jgi:hypothetical protein
MSVSRPDTSDIGLTPSVRGDFRFSRPEKHDLLRSFSNGPVHWRCGSFDVPWLGTSLSVHVL